MVCNASKAVGRSPSFVFWRKVGYQAFTWICNHLISECGLYVIIAHTRLSNGYKSRYRLDTAKTRRSGYAQLHPKQISPHTMSVPTQMMMMAIAPSGRGILIMM